MTDRALVQKLKAQLEELGCEPAPIICRSCGSFVNYPQTAPGTANPIDEAQAAGATTGDVFCLCD